MYHIKLKRQILFDYFGKQESVGSILSKLKGKKPSHRIVYFWIKYHNDNLSKLKDIQIMEMKKKKGKTLTPREGYPSIEEELLAMRKFYDIRIAELTVEKTLKKK